jgi:hypothetical protein
VTGTPHSFGQYDLLEQLGNSPTGAIWKARHRVTGRIVALKLLSRQAAASADFVERFHRKTKILAELNHPNVIAAHQAGQEGQTFFLVMEYVDGQNLTAVVKDRGPLPVDEAVGYLRQAAEGLAHVHRHGICHRDVKPGNLLLDGRGVLKVVGFGMAHIDSDRVAGAAGQENLTQQGQTLGTYDYMPPEQAVDSRRADPRCDVYSLGCTLHTLLVGRPPYAGKSITAQLMAHQASPAPRLRAARSDMPEWLDQVFAKMLAKRPEDRFSSMQEVIAALDAGQAQPGTAAAAGGGSPTVSFVDRSRMAGRAGAALDGEKVATLDGEKVATLAGEKVATSVPLATVPEKQRLSRAVLGAVLGGTCVLGLALAWLTWYLMPGPNRRSVATITNPSLEASDTAGAAGNEETDSAIAPKVPRKPKKTAAHNSGPAGNRSKVKPARKKPADTRQARPNVKRAQDDSSWAVDHTGDAAPPVAQDPPRVKTPRARPVKAPPRDRQAGQVKPNLKRTQDDRSSAAEDSGDTGQRVVQNPAKTNNSRVIPDKTPLRDPETRLTGKGLAKRSGYYVLPEESQFIRDTATLEKLRTACFGVQKEAAQVQRQLDRAKSMKAASVQARIQADHADRYSWTWREHWNAVGARNTANDAEMLADLSSQDLEKWSNDVHADLQRTVGTFSDKCQSLRQSFHAMKAKYEALSHDNVVQRALKELSGGGDSASGLGPSPAVLAAVRKLDHEEGVLAQFTKTLDTRTPQTTK